MNWEKTFNIPALTTDIESLLIIYSTNSLENNLPVTEIITHNELAYSVRLRNEEQRSTWLSCRATLRLILGSWMNKKPCDIEFRKGRFGKLSLPGTNLFFNVSHSNDAFLIGFNYGGRIGIDIEILNGSEDLHSMVNYAFSEAETHYCSFGENHERFAEIWTLKEAFLKAVGVGLVDQLKSVNVTGDFKNDILRYKLNQKSFCCPNGETGSIVYRTNKPLKFICLK